MICAFYCVISQCVALDCYGSTVSPFDGIPECDGLSKVNSAVTAKPVAKRLSTDANSIQKMLFMAMAFKSVSDSLDHVML